MSLSSVTFGQPLVTVLLYVIGVSLLAGLATAGISFLYRLRVRKPFPEGPTLIVGLGVVGLYLGTRLVLVQFMGAGEDPLDPSEALVNIILFVVAGFASYGGRTVGDRWAQSERADWRRFQPDLSPMVRATGRFISVTLPETIHDIEGYDVVDDTVKESLAGRRFDFPRGLTLAQVEDQLTIRLKEEHAIGYVDVDLDQDGTVQYLALGERATGLGQSIPPTSAAIAVRADPPFSATAGDAVQLWHSDTSGEVERVGSGELRANVGSVITVVVDADVAADIDPTVTYRLMTLSADRNPEREFAALLRRGDETMSVVTVGEESPLVGTRVNEIEATVIAIRDTEDHIDTLPSNDRPIEQGDDIFVIGRPDAIRQLEGVRDTQPLDFAEVTDDGEIAPSRH